MTEPSKIKHKLKKRYIVIKSNRDFSYLFRKGDSTVNYAFVCYMKPRRAGKNRLGVVSGKKVGNAVKRNRSRRIIREAFRLFEPIMKEKTDKRYDFVFVARAKTPTLKTQQVLSLMKKNILPKLQ
ncbi:MAG: ribonuclease P protein component [Oscillospiraceae bacterium]|nr:ribonuclease P protein component [Oscillospiraceae bacterium]